MPCLQKKRLWNVHSVLSGHLYHTWALKVHRSFQKREWKECEGQKWWVTTVSKCSLNTIGPSQTWTHSDCDSKHKACASSNQTKIPAWRGMVEQNAIPSWGGIGNGQLLEEEDTFSFWAWVLVGEPSFRAGPTLRSIWIIQTTINGFRKKNYTVGCVWRGIRFGNSGGMWIWSNTNFQRINKKYTIFKKRETASIYKVGEIEEDTWHKPCAYTSTHAHYICTCTHMHTTAAHNAHCSCTHVHPALAHTCRLQLHTHAHCTWHTCIPHLHIHAHRTCTDTHITLFCKHTNMSYVWNN